MSERSFRFRESYGKAVKEMDDKRAGKFIKSLCAYAFEGKTLEDNDTLLKSNFHLVKMVMDAEARDRENGRKGGQATAENKKVQAAKVAIITQSPRSSTTFEDFLQELILSAAEEAGREKSLNRESTQKEPEKKS